jgi:predicted enzyme related to lactoylglutathione lyase
MKRTIFLIIGFAASFCLGFFLKGICTKQSIGISKQPNNISNMGKVTGVGGIFFKCKDPKLVKEWYKTHLGFNTDEYGARFVSEGADTTKKEVLQWSPFSETTKYFAPSTKDFMINYKVDDLVGLIEQLKKDGVTIVDTMETYDYGKFIHIMDIEGNKIELWEPIYK